MKYHASYPVLLALSALIAIPCVVVSWPELPIGLAIGGAAAAYFSLLVRLFPIIVNEEGIRLYRMNWLPWGDVVSARRVRVIFLPYLMISRERGMRWFVPLFYYRADGTIEAALAARAPLGNPIRNALSASRKDQLATR